MVYFTIFYHTLYHGLLILPYTQQRHIFASNSRGLARPGGRGVHCQIGIQGELLRWKTMGFNGSTMCEMSGLTGSSHLGGRCLKYLSTRYICIYNYVNMDGWMDG